MNVKWMLVQGGAGGCLVEIKLSKVEGEKLLSCEWNHGGEFPTMFAACTSSGSVTLYTVSGPKFTVLAAASLSATCCECFQQCKCLGKCSL